jgi:hypothetical protein
MVLLMDKKQLKRGGGGGRLIAREKKAGTRKPLPAQGGQEEKNVY